MPLSLLAVLAFQDVTLQRDLRAGRERRYRARVEVDGGNRFAYRIALKIPGSKVPVDKAAEVKLEIKLSDYRATVDGHEVKNSNMGGGVLEIGPTGLPTGLDITGQQGPYWLPLLSLYLPDGKDGESPIVKTIVGAGLSLEGKSTLSRKDGKSSVAIDASVMREGKPLGKITLTVSLTAEGWPRKAEGTLVSADGTYHFTLERGLETVYFPYR